MSASAHEHAKRTPVTRTQALRLIVVAYLLALAAGAATLVLAPIDDPLAKTFAADVAATLVIFGFSFAFDNSSFYDAYWSVIPIAIVLYWVGLTPDVAPMARVAGLCFVVVVWGVRLTWNWTRGWTGLDHEDWRYVGLRSMGAGLYWPISFVGLHFFPTVIVFAGLWAAHPAVATAGRPLGLLDLAAFAVGLAAIAFEWIADDQLRAFTTGPKRPGETLRTGLWRYSRHPNYFGEVLVWWSFFLFGAAADPARAKVAILAPLAMTAMFLFVSIPMIEKRSLERRAEYQRVIDETSMLVPLPPRRPKAR